MSTMKEFKEFAMRGNVIDMAVGIVIGVAFGKIVSSLVTDLLMPPLGLLLGGVNFNDLFLILGPEPSAPVTSLAQAKQQGIAVIAYGSFIQTVIDFLIIAFAIFLVIKLINRFRSIQQPAEATTKDCPFCLSSIPSKAKLCAHCGSTV